MALLRVIGLEGGGPVIKTDDAIRVARSLIGTPYKELDCINLIKKVIRTAPGGVGNYTTAGTNSLWKSLTMSKKYRDLTWRGEGIGGACAGMLAFKREGSDVHHVGLVTGEGTVIHSSSGYGEVVETALDKTWHLLGVHRYIRVAPEGGEAENKPMDACADAVQHSGLVTIIDSEENVFCPVGDCRVILGSRD